MTVPGSSAVSGVESIARGVWWLVLLRGILGILFGLILLFTPGTALLALVFVFGIYAVLDGITAVVAGIRHRSQDNHWGWHVVQGVISVAAGIVAFVWPGVTVLAILFVIAFWSIVNGIAQISESLAMRRNGSTTWGWMLAAGILSIVFGILLLVWPKIGLVSLLWIAGIYALVFGIVVVVWAFRLRSAISAVAGSGTAPAAGDTGPAAAGGASPDTPPPAGSGNHER
ncbi:HdeD family acid-resistance protein [Pseudonocardia dioxanivorans]|uniref:HdeD family acid-resistance protein n=1 Tax=Pseudonocardia dioxanivorans TaxID=240495 RepID=UPI0011810868|nr:HdeD family acid-resistance protein [Pseudonocardia dioxanivorans]